MDSALDLPPNPAPAHIMYIDFNSCFATIEQQANPNYRHKPLVVAAYNHPSCCVLAASIEAKKLGIKTGTRVKDALLINKKTIILEPDTDKYLFVHHQLHEILLKYSPSVISKSIDEFAIDFSHSPLRHELLTIAKKIKTEIREHIGEWVTVSVGLGPSHFFAKTAAGLKKPDGLEILDNKNALKVFSHLTLTFLNGINIKNELRLNSVGIYTPLDFYNASYPQLKQAFKSILARQWLLRLRGYEVDDRTFPRRSFGNSYVLPQPLPKQDALPILYKLVHKASQRLRQAGYQTKAITLVYLFNDHSHFNHQKQLPHPCFSISRLYTHFLNVSNLAPDKPIRTIFATCHNLSKETSNQLELFHNTIKDRNLTQAIDDINQSWGDFTLTPANVFTVPNAAPDRIAFGQNMVRHNPSSLGLTPTTSFSTMTQDNL